MSKTHLRHILTKNSFDIVVDFYIFIHFHLMKIHRSLLFLQRQKATCSRDDVAEKIAELALKNNQSLTNIELNSMTYNVPMELQY